MTDRPELPEMLTPETRGVALVQTPAAHPALGAFLTRLASAAPTAVPVERALSAHVERAIRELVDPRDVRLLQGKRVLNRNAWAVLARHFRIDTRVTMHELTPGADGHTAVVATVEATGPWLQTVTEVGACDSREPRFAKGAPLHFLLATAVTRARSRAIAALLAVGALADAEDEGERTEVPVAAEHVITARPRVIDESTPFPLGKLAGTPLGELPTKALAHFAKQTALSPAWRDAIAAERARRARAA